jgi:ribosomal protein S7
MSEKTKPPPVEVFEQAMKNYEQALKTGLQLQEESAQWWNKALNQSSTVEELYKQIQTMTKDVIPTAQKRMKEFVKIIEQNSETSLDLLKKAVDASVTPPSAETSGKWVGFWEASLNAVRENAQAVTELNNHVVDAWLDFARKTTGPAEHKAKA